MICFLGKIQLYLECISGTLESSRCIEWLSEDTFISHNIIKRVWPASQRDAVFWSHIRHVITEDEEDPDIWIVVNYSTDHPSTPVSVIYNKFFFKDIEKSESRFTE